MNILKETISQLNKEEKRVFKVYVSRFNLHADRKDIALFNYYSKAPESLDEDEIYKKLYGSGNEKNAYYRLKNRLLEEINKTLIIDNISQIESINSHYLLSLYHYFHQKNNFKLANHYLKRAEKHAREFEQYELLDQIYSEFTKLSRELLTINPEEFIQLRKQNEERLRDARQLDEVLSVLSYRLKVTQNLDSSASPVLDIYENTIREFASKNVEQTPQFRIRIYKAISQLLIQRQDYTQLEPYLTQVYDEFSGEGIFHRNTHDTKIEMLIYLVNTLNSLGKFKDAIGYLQQFYEALMEFNKLHYHKYIYFYHQSMVASYSRIDPDKAIAAVKEMLASKEVSQSPLYQILAYSNMAFLQFAKSEFHACIKALNKVYIHDFYSRLDFSLKAKILTQELMARVEIGDYDLMEYRLEQIKKEFQEHGQEYHGIEGQLLLIIERIIKDPNMVKDKNFHKSVQKFISLLSPNSAEVDDYGQWLKAKLKIA